MGRRLRHDVLVCFLSEVWLTIDSERKDINQLFVVAFLSRLDGATGAMHFVSI